MKHDHLSSATVMDIVDGTASRGQLAHATTCEACHRRVADARAGLACALEDEVPEPSPLYWDHFARRVEDAVRQDGDSRRTWLPSAWRFRPVSVALAMSLMVAIGAAVWVMKPPSGRAPEPLGVYGGAQYTDGLEPVLAASVVGDEASWGMLSHMVARASAESGAGELVPPPAVGSSERMIGALTATEREELVRLLKEQLGEL